MDVNDYVCCWLNGGDFLLFYPALKEEGKASEQQRQVMASRGLVIISV